MVVVNLYVDNVHVDRRHALIVTALLHEVEDTVEISLGGFLVAADAVNVAEHVVGHVHLVVEVLLTQFPGELPSQHISFDYFPAVHLEDNLIAALGIVGM